MSEFTGERVIPGQVEPDLWNEHLARYRFAARLSRNRRVLDLACGTAYGSAELARHSAFVVALDCDAEAIEYGRRHYPTANLAFLRASAAQVPLPDAAFDVVVAFELIEHLDDWDRLLGESRRLLAADGQFLVSTPNKDYYARTREQSGPNPFHRHEFDYDEFRQALSAHFPHVSLFVQNHAPSLVFRPVEDSSGTETWLEQRPVAPQESHFLLAVCALTPQTGAPMFVYLPSAANVLGERELHIERLQQELALKNEWLEKSKSEHQRLLDLFAAQAADLDQRTEWAHSLAAQLDQTAARIVQLQEQLTNEQAAGLQTAAGYEAKIADLERENREKTDWAVQTEKRLGPELDEKIVELARCVELLQQAERTVEERTHWALGLEKEREKLAAHIRMMQSSRWYKLGRAMGMGPEGEIR